MTYCRTFAVLRDALISKLTSGGFRIVVVEKSVGRAVDA